MSLVKKFINYAVFSMLATLFGVLTLPILTAFLTPSEYGALGVSLSFLALLLPFNTLCNQQNVQVTKAKSTSSEYNTYWDSLCSLTLILSCLAFFSICIAIYFVELPSVFLLIPALSVIRALRLLKQAELTVTEKELLFGFSTLLIAFIGFSSTFLVFNFIESSAIARVACLVFSELLVAVLVLKVRFCFSCSRHSFYEIYKVGGPLIISTLPAWIINESNRFFLLHYHDLGVVGLYTVAFQMAVIYLQFNTALGNTFVKKIFDEINTLFDKRFLCKVVFFQAFFAFVFLVFFNLFVKYFMPTSYGSAIPVTNVLIYGVLFQSFGMLPTYYFSYYKTNKYRLYSLSAASLISILLNYILVPQYEAYGAAIAFVLSMAFYTLFLVLFMFYYSKKHD